VDRVAEYWKKGLPRLNMELNIKNEAAHKMAAELAGLRGTSLSQAVTEAIRKELEREKRRRARVGLSGELLKIGVRCASHLRGAMASSDHAAMLYDDRGLPR
jgi:antitoxin VapB